MDVRPALFQRFDPWPQSELALVPVDPPQAQMAATEASLTWPPTTFTTDVIVITIVTMAATAHDAEDKYQ